MAIRITARGSDRLDGMVGGEAMACSWGHGNGANACHAEVQGMKAGWIALSS